MNDFYKRFLQEDASRISPGTGRHVSLGAFGKHPGWDDHVEDLGLETESLILAKTLLYVQGIGGQIDSGAWEKLDPAQQLPGFKHVFVWSRGSQFLIGRMWSSSDGKGRTRYPMVLCLHFAGVPLFWALDLAMPRLKTIEEECRATRSAADVRAILDRHRRELRATVSAAGSSGTDEGPSRSTLTQFGTGPSPGLDQEGVARILYQMQGHMAAFAPGGAAARGDASVRPQQIRLPLAAGDVKEATLLWRRFFLAQVDPSAPLLFIAPLDGNWLDVTLGAPTFEEFLCLRASAKKLPFANEVPYNLEPEFKAWAGECIASFQTGGTQFRPFSPAAAKGSGASATGGTGTSFFKWKWLGGGAALVVVVAFAGVFLMPSGKDKSGPAGGATVESPPAKKVSDLASAQTDSAEQARQKAEAAAKARAEADARAKAKADADAKAKADTDRQRLIQDQAQRDAAAKAKAEADARAKAKADADARAKAEADVKAKADADRQRMIQEQAQRDAAARAKAEADALAKAKAEADAKTKAEADRQRMIQEQAQRDAAAKAKAEADALAKAKADADARAKAEADAKAKAEADRQRMIQEQAQRDAAARAKAEADAKATAATTTQPTASGAPQTMTNSIGMVLVKVADDLWVGKFEVTQAEFEKVMGANPSRFKGPRMPVETVSWDEATEFCRKLSAIEREAKRLPDRALYALPPQRRWEQFVADAKFEDGVVTSPTATRTSTAEVGSTGKPNRFGLLDLYGNVWEWCSDEGTTNNRLARGGAYNSRTATSVAAAYSTAPAFKAVNIGFRCVLVIP